MTSFDDVLAQVQPRTEMVRVCLRGDLIAAHQRADHELQQLLVGRGHDADTVAAAEAVQAIEQQMRDATVEFVFQHLGRTAWTDLLAEHPPTDEQKAANPRLDNNPETFPYAAMAASCIAPENATADSFRDLEERITAESWDQMWAATLVANLGGRDPGESGAASAVLRRLRPRSEQPSDAESDAASSSADQ